MNQPSRAVSLVNRERERRREPRTGGGRLSARVRPGYHLVVIDLSTRGVLVEAGRPLRPGSRVEVHLESDTNRTLVAARVLRCSVAALHSESGVTYRAALAFNEICEWVRECGTPGESDLPGLGSDAALAGAIAGESIPVLPVALIDPIALGSE